MGTLFLHLSSLLAFQLYYSMLMEERLVFIFHLSSEFPSVASAPHEY